MTQTPTPAAPSLAQGEDSGASNSDGLIDTSNPILIGQTLPNAIITLYDNNIATTIANANGDAISDVTADANGFYSFYPFPVLDDGKHTLTITATAPGETASQYSAPLYITVDTSKPDAPVAPQLAAGYDTGASAEDGITDKNIVVLTGQAEPGTTVQLFLADADKSKLTGKNEIMGAALAKVVTAANGTYTLTTSKLADGTYNLSVTATDPAGNVSTPSAPSSITIDTIAPAAPSAPTLSLGTDTGVSHTDGLTSNSSPVITGTTEANATVNVYDESGLIGKGIADGSGNYAITPTSPLSDGAHEIVVQATDAAGNVSAQSPQLNIVVDTTTAAGTATPQTSPTLFGSEQFTLQFNEAVNGLTTRALQLTTTGTASGSIGSISGSGSQYVVTVEGLTGTGTISLGLKPGLVTSPAGNPATLTEATPYQVNGLTAPQPILITTISSPAATDDALSLSAGGRLIAFDSKDGLPAYNSTTGMTANAGNAGNVYVEDVRTGALTLVTAGLDGALSNGASGYAKLSDNGSTIVFTSSATNLVAGAPTDGSTNVYSAHLAVSGSGSAEKIVVSGITLLSTGNGHDGISTPSVDGSEPVSLITPEISADGNHAVFVSNQPLISGMLNNGVDNIFEENLTTGALTLISGGPTGKGGLADSLDPTVSADGSKVAYDGGLAVSTAPANSVSGNFEATVFDTTTGATTLYYGATQTGINTSTTPGIYLKIYDQNPSISSDGNWLTYTIVQADPNQALEGSYVVEQSLKNPSIIQVLSPLQTGYEGLFPSVNQGGRYVAYTQTYDTIDFGNAPGQLGLVLDDTVTKTKTFFSSSVDTSVISDDGDAIAYVTDPETGSPQIFVQPLDAVVQVDAVGDDDRFDASAWKQVQTSGLLVSGTTNQANGATVMLTLTDSAGDILATLSKIAVTGGVWSTTIPGATLAPLSDGSYTLSAIVDGIGGASFPAGPAFTVDTMPPSAPDAPKLDAGSDTSTADDGSATNQAMPVFTGTAEAGATVSLYDSQSATPGTPIGTGIADSDGVYTITPDAPLTNAKHVFTVTATDAAGNVSGVSAGDSVTVDTIAPVQPNAPMLQPGSSAGFDGSSLVDDPSAPAIVGSDTGSSDSDGITSNASPNIVGVAAPNTTVTLYDTDGIAVLGTAKTDAAGKYLIASSNLSDGVHDLTVTDTDEAGNVSPVSGKLVVTIDTLPPAMPTISSVTGPLVSGKITEIVTVNGTAEPGSTVKLVLDGGSTAASIFGETTAASDGDYSINSDPLPAGDGQNLSVTATDVAGNTSQPSLPVDVNITDSPTPPPGVPTFTPTLLGLLTDGPIAGATVFADSNGNGVRDADEGSAITNADGAFQLVNTGGELVATGGIDASTGLANVATLLAPAGSEEIDPLTTLLAFYMRNSGAALAAAQASVTAALGLAGNGGTDLTKLDPVSAAVSGSPALDPAVADGAPLIASAKIMDTAIDFANVLAGDVLAPNAPSAATIDAEVNSYFGAVVNAMAVILQQSGSLDLDDQAVLNTILTKAASNLDITAAFDAQAANQPTAVAIVAAENADLDGLAAGATLPTAVAQVEDVAQGAAAAALEGLPHDTASAVTNLQTKYTGQALYTATSASLSLLKGGPQFAPGSDTGESDRDNTTTDADPTFIGKATPGSYVTIFQDKYSVPPGGFYPTSSTVAIGTGIADVTGNYSITVTSLTADTLAGYPIVVGAVASATDPHVTSGDIITVPAAAPTLTVYLDPGVGYPPSIEAATPAPGASDSADSALLVYGMAAEGTNGSSIFGVIKVYADGGTTPIATGFLNGDAAYALTTTPLSLGQHTLTVTETLPGGTVSTSAPFSVTVTAPSFVTGIASASGAIANATVYEYDQSPDQNNTETLSITQDAVSSITNAAGAYTDTYNATYGAAVTLRGGYDTLTGVPLGGYVAQVATLQNTYPAELMAPYDFSAISPLTTLLAMADGNDGITGGATPADNDGNEADVLAAFGLPTTLDLATLDPVAMAQAGNTAPFLVTAKLLDTVTILSGLVGFNFEPLADYLATTPSINLDSASDIVAAYSQFLAQSPAYNQSYENGAALAEDLPAVAAIVAASNQAIDAHAAAATSMADLLSYTLAAETFAQEAETEAVAVAVPQDPGDGSSLAALEPDFTGAALQAGIEAARAQATQATNFVPDGPATTQAPSVAFTITFSKAITGLTAKNFSIIAGGDLTGVAIRSVTAVAGSGGKQYEVTVGTGAGEGTLALSFNGDGLTSAIGKPITDGLFAPAVTTLDLQSPSSNPEGSIAVGDFNGDGKVDALVGGNDGTAQYSLTLYINNGDGTFTAQAPITGAPHGYDLVVGDFNGDGKLDVAQIGDSDTSNPATLAIMLGNGDGTFQPAIDTQIAPGALAEGDFNGDGKLDLAVSSFNTDTVSILLGNGDGTFIAGPSITTASPTNEIVSADLTGNGKADLVMSNPGANTVSVFLGNGDGTFTAAPGGPIAVGNEPEGIAIGDLNGDGIPDIAVADFGSNSITVLLGKGNGTFTALAPIVLTNIGSDSTFFSNFQPNSIAISDVDNDGKADLVVAATQGTVVLNGNGDGTFTLGDFTANGVVGNDLGDALALADTNGDGRTDILEPGTVAQPGIAAGTSGLNVLQNEAPTVLGSTSGSVTIDRPAVAQPKVTKVSGGGTLTQDGNTYTIDLGTLTQGQTAADAVLAIVNGATGSADSLDGLFGAATGSGFTVSGETLPGALAAGQSYGGLTFSVDTSTPGSHSETITFAPRDVTTETAPTTTVDGFDGSTTQNATAAANAVALELPAITLVVKDDVTAGTSPPAQAALGVASTNFVLANVRVGAADTRAISVANTAAAPADELDVTAAASGDATVSGSVSGLAAGATDATDIVAGIDTASGGAKTGTVVLTPVSEPDTTLPTESVSVSGSVFREATASAAAVNLVVHMGDPGSAAIKISNTDAADGFSEALIASLTAVTGGFSIGSGSSTADIAAGGSDDTSLVFDFSTAKTGTITGTATIGLISDGGTGAGSIDGLGKATLTSIIVPITVTVEPATAPVNQASLGLSASAIALPNVRVGATDTEALGVSNTAAAPADALDVTAKASGDATVSGSVTGLAAGASDDTGIAAGIDTATAGAKTGSVTLTPVSEPDSPLPTRSVAVSGSVYREASAAVTPINLVVHVGDADSAFLKLSNSDPADGYSEALIASISATTGGLTIAAGGATPDIAAGASNSALAVGFSTAKAGVITGSAVLDLVSDGGTGAGSIDGLGKMTLAASTVPITVTVDNLAQAGLTSSGGVLTAGSTPGTWTLNLGTTVQGSAALVAALDVANIAGGPADLLGGSFTVASSDGFSNSGFTGFSGLAAGASDNAGSIALSTAATGTFSETVTLKPTDTEGTNAPSAQTPQTVTITGTIVQSTGTATGDVHMVTFDGLHYDFQATGDFVLARSTQPGNSFQIQMRAEQFLSFAGTSVATEIAAQVGRDVVSFSNTGAAVTVNGIADTALLASPGMQQQLDGGTLTALSSNSFQLTWKTGETLDVTNDGVCLDSSVQLAPQDGAGSMQGLLGTDSGQANDFALPDGTVLAQPVASQTLLGTFADAWRVAPKNSILDTGSQTAAGSVDIRTTQTVLGAIPFLKATALAANDQIGAGSGEILTGSSASGLLNQAALPGVTFHGTLAALGSDIFSNFGANDFIDISDLAGGNAALLATGSAGVLHVAYGGKSADLTFSSIAGKPFEAIADGHGGTLIGYA
jgi:hypothetical protein